MYLSYQVKKGQKNLSARETCAARSFGHLLTVLLLAVLCTLVLVVPSSVRSQTAYRRSLFVKDFVCKFGSANLPIDAWSVKESLYLRLNRPRYSTFSFNNNNNDVGDGGDAGVDIDLWDRNLALYNMRLKQFVKLIPFNDTNPSLGIYDHTRPLLLNDSIPIADVIQSYLIRSDLSNKYSTNPLSILYFEQRSALRHYCHNDWFYDAESSRFCRRHPIVTGLDRILAFGGLTSAYNLNTIQFALFRSSLLREDSIIEDGSVRSVSRASTAHVRDTLKHYISASVLTLQVNQPSVPDRQSRETARYMFSNKLGLFISWYVQSPWDYTDDNDTAFPLEHCASLMSIKLLPSIKLCSKQNRFVSFVEFGSSIYALMSNDNSVVELTHDFLKKQYRLHNNLDIDVDQLKSDNFYEKFFDCSNQQKKPAETVVTNSSPEHRNRLGSRRTRRPQHRIGSVTGRTRSSHHKVVKRSFDYSNLDEQLKVVSDAQRRYNYDGAPMLIRERGVFSGAGGEHASSWWYLAIVIIFVLLCCLAFLLMYFIYKKEKPLEDDEKIGVSSSENAVGTFGLPIIRQGHFKITGKFGSIMFDAKGSSPLVGKRSNSSPSRLSHVNKIRDLNYKRGGAGAVAHAISLHDDPPPFVNTTTTTTTTTITTAKKNQDEDEIVKFVGKMPPDLQRKEDKILQQLKHRKSNTSNRSDRSIKSNCSAGVSPFKSNASNQSGRSTKTNGSIKSNVSQKGSNASTKTNATIKIISAKTTNVVPKTKSATSSIKSNTYSIKSAKPTTLTYQHASKSGSPKSHTYSIKSARPMGLALPKPQTSKTGSMKSDNFSIKSARPMGLALPMPQTSKTGSMKSGKFSIKSARPKGLALPMPQTSKTGSMKSDNFSIKSARPRPMGLALPMPQTSKTGSMKSSTFSNKSTKPQGLALPIPGLLPQASNTGSIKSSKPKPMPMGTFKHFGKTGPHPLLVAHHPSHTGSTKTSALPMPPSQLSDAPESGMSSNTQTMPSQQSSKTGSVMTSKNTSLPMPSSQLSSTNESGVSSKTQNQASQQSSNTGSMRTGKSKALPQPGSQISGKSRRPMALPMPSRMEKSSTSKSTVHSKRSKAARSMLLSSSKSSKPGGKRPPPRPMATKSKRSLPGPKSAAALPPPLITTTITTTTIIEKLVPHSDQQPPPP